MPSPANSRVVLLVLACSNVVCFILLSSLFGVQHEQHRTQPGDLLALLDLYDRERLLLELLRSDLMKEADSQNTRDAITKALFSRQLSPEFLGRDKPLIPAADQQALIPTDVVHYQQKQQSDVKKESDSHSAVQPVIQSDGSRREENQQPDAKKEAESANAAQPVNPGDGVHQEEKQQPDAKKEAETPVAAQPVKPEDGVHQEEKQQEQPEVRAEPESPGGEAPEVPAKNESERLEFKFQSRLNTTFSPLPLNIEKRQMEALGLLHPHYAEIPQDVTIDDFVIVTAANDGYFAWANEEVGSLHSSGIKNTIYMYDLGLSEANANKARRWCNVVLRKFNFDLYPPHVALLKTYAWKAIMIAEVMKEHPGVFWFDTSVKVKSTGSMAAIFEKLRAHHGGLSLTTAGNSVHYATHPRMMEYLPTSIQLTKEQHMRESTFIFYRTEIMMEKIIKWMVLCALTEDCIAPQGANVICARLMSGKEDDQMANYGECHRFDQSVVNLVMMDYFGDTTSFFEGGAFVGVMGKIGLYNATICN